MLITNTSCGISTCFGRGAVVKPAGAEFYTSSKINRLSEVSCFVINQDGALLEIEPALEEDFDLRGCILSFEKLDSIPALQEEQYHKLLPLELKPYKIAYRKQDIPLNVRPYCEPGSFIRAKAESDKTFFGATFGDGHAWFVRIDPKIIDTSSVSSQVSKIQTASGICLFGAQGAMVKTREGEIYSLTDPHSFINHDEVVELSVSDKLSLYEIEALARIASFTRSLFRANKLCSQMNLFIPREQYYTYFLPPNERVQIPTELISKWFSEVDKRSALLTNLFVRSIGEDVKRIEFKQPLLAISQYLREEINSGRIPSIYEALSLLKKSGGLWTLLLGKCDIKSWQQLNHLSYVHYLLESSLCNGQDGNFGLQIDCPQEAPVFRYAGEAAMKLGLNVRLGAVYPHEEILLPRRFWAPNFPNGGGLFHVPVFVDNEVCSVILNHFNIQLSSTC